MGKPRMLGKTSGFVPNSQADRRRVNRTSKRWDTLGMRWDFERLEKKLEKEMEKEKGASENGESCQGSQGISDAD